MAGGFFAGVGLFNMFCLSRIIWLLGKKFELKVERHPYGIMTTGNMLVKCYFVAAAIWFVFTFSAAFGLPSGWIPMAMLAAPSIIFFVAAFITCQIPIHNRMVDYKKAEILNIQKDLESLFPLHAENLTEERERRLSSLKGDWPV